MIIKKIFLSLICIVLLVGFLELRKRSQSEQNGYLTFDRKYDHVPLKNYEGINQSEEFKAHIRINSHGFRGAEFPLQKPATSKRIFVLGDSFGMGAELEEEFTIARHIEDDLKREISSVEVINAGVSSYSPIIHYLRLRDEYLKFKPDLVVLLFDFCDLYDDWRYEKNSVVDGDGKLVRIDPLYMQGRLSINHWLMHHLKSYAIMHHRWSTTFSKLKILGVKEYFKAKLKGRKNMAYKSKISMFEKVYQSQNQDPIDVDRFFMIRNEASYDQILAKWKHTQKYLKEINDLLVEKNIPWVLVSYPYGHQVAENQWVNGRLFWALKSNAVYDTPIAYKLLEDFSTEHNVPYINMLDVFRMNKNKKLFFDSDGHFTGEATKLIASATLSKIKKSLKK